jgi:hypothetical protein
VQEIVGLVTHPPPKPSHRVSRPSAAELATLLASLPDRNPTADPGDHLSAPVYVPALMHSLLTCLVPRGSGTSPSLSLEKTMTETLGDPGSQRDSNPPETAAIEGPSLVPSGSVVPRSPAGVHSLGELPMDVSPVGPSGVAEDVLHSWGGTASTERQEGSCRDEAACAHAQFASSRSHDLEAGRRLDEFVGDLLVRLCRRGHVSHVAGALWAFAAQGPETAVPGRTGEPSGGGLVAVQRAVQAVQQGPCLQQLVEALLVAAAPVAAPDPLGTVEGAAETLSRILGPLWDRTDAQFRYKTQ